MLLCTSCNPKHEDGDDSEPVEPRFSTYEEADFTDPTLKVWPDEWLGREQWMGHVEKMPFAPWADRDHPEAAPDEDARWKWGLEENYVDGATVAMAEDDPRLDGRAFLQQEDDPYAYIDGDDVRDPETGEVHPVFIAFLELLGATYCDVSQSSAGVHAVFRGDLPEDVKEASWRIGEEPWGANEDLPSIEIYDGKRVYVATGEHVSGTPKEICEWDDDALEGILNANGQLPVERDRGEIDVEREEYDYDSDEYEPSASSSDETATDIRDLFAAIDRLDAQRVAEQTIVQRWNGSASTSSGERAFWPSWGSLNDGGTANIVNAERWQDTGELGGYGGPVSMAAIDAGEIRPQDAPDKVRGETWWRGVEHLRELGFDIPEYEPGTDSAGHHDGEATSVLPLGQLEALDPAERRRFAKKRGLDWPTTSEARDELFASIAEVMRHEDDRVVDAPTSLGKSYTIASTDWSKPSLDDVTGNRQVVHLSKTRDARDENVETARDQLDEDDWFVLKARHEACPVAAGDHDPDEDESNDRPIVTLNGEPASEWLASMCDGKGIPFSVAHSFLSEHNDQGRAELPCCEGGECPAIDQWRELREGNYSLVFGTHEFAHVPNLRLQTNVVIDEQPDFVQDDLGQDRIRRAVTAYLQEIDAEVRTWEELLRVSRDGLSLNEHDQRDLDQRWTDLHNALANGAGREWFLENPDAHTLAPAIARAILQAEDRGNGRRAATVSFEPPRLDAQAREEDGWNREWCSVVLDEDNTIRQIRVKPDLQLARSVVGLDAHPALPVWQANSVPWIERSSVLDPQERQLWRRYERGLRVVQVGDATRPLASGEYFQPEQVGALAEHLRREFGEDFRTGITTSAVEPQFDRILDEAGVHDPETMHYGEEKSRNDFADEPVGIVEGCIDPGDDYVLDLLAELDLDAEPETTVDDAGDEHRARGRGFEGTDAGEAQAILASVRENHTAQAAGRYARNPDDPDSTATVFVRTDAMPVDFADVQVPGVEWVYGEQQRAIAEDLREATGTRTAREIAEERGVSQRHVQRTLKRLVDHGVVHAAEGQGDHGATLYADDGLPVEGMVDVDIATGDVQDPYTWGVAIRDPAVLGNGSSRGNAGGGPSSTSTWNWKSASQTEGSPPST